MDCHCDFLFAVIDPPAQTCDPNQEFNPEKLTELMKAL